MASSNTRRAFCATSPVLFRFGIIPAWHEARRLVKRAEFQIDPLPIAGPASLHFRFVGLTPVQCSAPVLYDGYGRGPLQRAPRFWASGELPFRPPRGPRPAVPRSALVLSARIVL